MVPIIQVADLSTCAALLWGVPTVAWLGLCAVAIGGLIYWALDFYFLEALLWKFSIAVESGVDSSVSDFVKAKCASLKRRYRSTPWLCSPHLQTVYLHFDPWSPAVKYRREVFQLSDGGCVGLDWAGTEQPTTPTVVIIPGLTSDSSNAYLRYLVADITKQGWRAVVVNHRGLGGVALSSETFYNAGWTQDMREVLSVIKSRFPAAPLALTGCSLGANMVIKYLGEEGPESFLWGAVAMGCPFDLLVCDRFMNRNFVQRLWNSALAHGLKEFAELHKEPFSKVTDFVTLQRSRTLREFDDRITRFTAKYETVDTYYRRCSSAPYMTSVRTPLLALSALDDPICTKESIPWDECRLNPYVILATAPRGGHLAVYDGWLPCRLWWTKPCVEFLGGIFEKGFRGLEPVEAAVNGVVPRVGLPLVHGVGEDMPVENGFGNEAWNGETEASLGSDATPLEPMIAPKMTVGSVDLDGVRETALGEGIPPQRPKPNGIHVNEDVQLTSNGLHGKPYGVHSHLNGVHSHLNGMHPQPNGAHSHLNGFHSQPNGVHDSDDDLIQANELLSDTCPESPRKPTVNSFSGPVKPKWTEQNGTPEWAERNGTPEWAERNGAPRSKEKNRTPEWAERNGTPEVAERNGGPTRVVIEFSDEAQMAVVEAFLSEVLEQMQGVAAKPLPVNQSLKDAALVASSAAASASAVAAAAAAVVRSASAAALAVQSPSKSTSTAAIVQTASAAAFAVQSPSKSGSAAVVVQSTSAAPLAVRSPSKSEPLDAGDRDTLMKYDSNNYSELVKCFDLLTRDRNKGTWLLAYVAVAVTFPMIGAVWRMRASQRLKGATRLAKKLGPG